MTQAPMRFFRIGLARSPTLRHNCRPGAGWSSLAARRAHNPKVVGSNPTPATTDGSSGAPGNRGAVCFCADSGLEHHGPAAFARDGMRHEARAVAGDRRVVLADA